MSIFLIFSRMLDSGIQGFGFPGCYTVYDVVLSTTRIGHRRTTRRKKMKFLHEKIENVLACVTSLLYQISAKIPQSRE